MPRKRETAVATIVAMVVTNMVLMVLVRAVIHWTVWKKQSKQESQNDLVLVSAQMENCMMIKLVICSNMQEG